MPRDEIVFSFIESAEIPSAKKPKKSAYDPILDEFIKSGLQSAKLKPIQNKTNKTIISGLNQRILLRKLDVSVISRENEVYLKVGKTTRKKKK
jgi:hypothetical protein